MLTPKLLNDFIYIQMKMMMIGKLKDPPKIDWEIKSIMRERGKHGMQIRMMLIFYGWMDDIYLVSYLFNTTFGFILYFFEIVIPIIYFDF